MTTARKTPQIAKAPRKSTARKTPPRNSQNVKVGTPFVHRTPRKIAELEAEHSMQSAVAAGAEGIVDQLAQSRQDPQEETDMVQHILTRISPDEIKQLDKALKAISKNKKNPG